MTLPAGWSSAEVRELVDLVNGYAFKPTDWGKAGRPIIRIQNLNRPEAGFNFFDGILPKKYLVRNGDLLFAWSGTPGTSFGAHIWRGDEAWLNQHIFNVRFDERHIDKRFLRLAINQNLAEYVRAAHGGAGLAHITKGVFESSRLLVPPLSEQRRIVAEIETQFTRLDAAVAALERALANLKRYRQSVLNAACAGELVRCGTGFARSENRGFDTADHLSTELPAGWTWTTLGVLLREPLRYGHSAKASGTDQGVRTLTLSAVTNRDFSIKNTKLTVAELSRVTNLWLEPGDIFIERSNTPELVGTAALYRGDRGFAIFPDLLIRARVAEAISASYLEIVLRSDRSRQFFRQRAQGIAGSMPKIDQTTVSTLLVPLPPLPDQHRIVVEIEQRLSLVDAIEATVDANVKRADRMRQAILRKAFAGQLVPQDSDDEPASVLLERIREERSATALLNKSKPKGRGRMRKLAEVQGVLL